MRKERDKLLEFRFKLESEMSGEQRKLWESHVTAFKQQIENINRNIDKFNLTVPCFWQQMVHYDENKEVKKILQQYRNKMDSGQCKVDNSQCKMDSDMSVQGSEHYVGNTNQQAILPSISFKGVLQEIMALFKVQ